MATRRGTRFIELVGLPGAGKSTLMASLAEDGTFQGTVFAAKVAPAGVVVIAHAIGIFLRLLLRAPLCLTARLWRPGFWWLIAKLGYRAAAVRGRHDPVGAVLIDGGVTQPLISYLAEYGTPGATVPLGPLLETLPLPAALIYVRVPAATALARYRQRQTDTDRRSNVHASAAEFDAAFALCERIADLWVEEGRPLLVLDNKAAPNARRVRGHASALSMLKRQLAGDQ